ncbi:hypothetical protein NDU88_010761 [Pleurodeles waltl]|uniref:Uncharacterized protein n=1 Tax=Pleurodeles waltl TaxID=8319 RepID=A0AAV7PWN9_PLEWA|nr:hypothetical protein NDU88_010761 [Pleurodeles waltl]
MNNMAFETEADKHSLPPPPYVEGDFWRSAWFLDPAGHTNTELGVYPNPPPPTEGHGADPLPPPYSGPLYPSYLEDPSQWPTAVRDLELWRPPLPPEKVPSYLGYSIVTMVFCCLPLGIAALIFSLRTRRERGNRHYALRSSRKALTLNHVALALGGLTYSLVTILLLLVLYVDRS